MRNHDMYLKITSETKKVPLDVLLINTYYLWTYRSNNRCMNRNATSCNAMQFSIPINMLEFLIMHNFVCIQAI